jgi:hypothetical protein
MVSPLNAFLISGNALSMVDALFKPLSSQDTGTAAASTATPSVSSTSSSSDKVASAAIAAIQALVQGGPPASSASTTASASGSTATGGASGNTDWMAQNIAKFETVWKQGEVIWENNKQFVPKNLLAADQAYETAVSTAIANHTMTYVPASQAPGLDVCENTTTWATGSETYYGYNGDALNAFVKSQGKNGGLVIWGNTPRESTVALW